MQNVVAVLLVGFQILLTGAQEQCCLPSRFEGQKHYVERQETVDFAVNFEASRIYENIDEAGETFFIIDIDANTIHFFADGTCRTSTLEQAVYFQQCYDDQTRITSLSLGELELPTVVDAHIIQAETFTRTYYFTTRDSGVCMPFYANDVSNDGVSIFNIHFGAVTPSVTGSNADRIYSDLTNCTNELSG